MRLDELVNAPQVQLYHWTNAETFRQILRSNALKALTRHDIEGRDVGGVSMSRNPFFDITATYAISGLKAWRIGLYRQKLANQHRIRPMRDSYLRRVPRQKSRMQPVFFGDTLLKLGDRRVSSDESEEFVEGDIAPLHTYLASVGVDVRFVDALMHPDEMEEDEIRNSDVEITTRDDQALLLDIMAGLLGANRVEKTLGWRRQRPISLNVPIMAIDVQGHQQQPLLSYYGEDWLVDTTPRSFD